MLRASTWLPRNAPGYANLSAREKRSVRDFALIWSLFEAQVFDCNADAVRMLRAIELWPADDIMDISIEDSWRYFVQRLTDGQAVNDRFRALRIRSAAHRQLVESALTVLPPGPDLITRHKCLAVVIHRLRNNLFHGEKWSFGLADQEANFLHAAHVLMVWTGLNRNAPIAHLLV